jgi:hypothetical protein
MTYQAKVQFSYVSDGDNTPSKYFPEMADQQTITISAPAQDLNVHQYYQLFKNFLRAVGFAEYSIMDGALRLAFSDENDTKQMNKLMEEYELQDKQAYSDSDYEELLEKNEQSVSEVKDLKARLSRALNPDNPNYTDQEMEAMTFENEVTKKTLLNAYKVCNDCGTKYGTYSAGCSSHWSGNCDVCGKSSSVTEARDYNYLEKGIVEISNETLAEKAEDFLDDLGIAVDSHSYDNIINQAQQHGFLV